MVVWWNGVEEQCGGTVWWDGVVWSDIWCSLIGRDERCCDAIARTPPNLSTLSTNPEVKIVC